MERAASGSAASVDVVTWSHYRSAVSDLSPMNMGLISVVLLIIKYPSGVYSSASCQSNTCEWSKQFASHL